MDPEMLSIGDVELLIHEVRGLRVILDEDIAAPFEVETGDVRPDARGRFGQGPSDAAPSDLPSGLWALEHALRSGQEYAAILKSQFVISRWEGVMLPPAPPLNPTRFLPPGNQLT